MREKEILAKLKTIPNGRFFKMEWETYVPVSKKYEKIYAVKKRVSSTVRKGIQYTNTKKYKENSFHPTSPPKSEVKYLCPFTFSEYRNIFIYSIGWVNIFSICPPDTPSEDNDKYWLATASHVIFITTDIKITKTIKSHFLLLELNLSLGNNNNKPTKGIYTILQSAITIEINTTTAISFLFIFLSFSCISLNI